MLHIHSGDCSADRARSASVPGEHLAWREALVAGPAPARDLLEARKAFLAEAYEADPAEVLRDVTRVREALRRAAHEEIVLWFDSDLFCQINLLFLLSEMSSSQPKSVMVSSGAEARRPISPQEISAAASGWAAYTSQNPRALEVEIEVPSPFATALALHLTRYPSTSNGLGADQAQLLRLVASGRNRLAELFQAFSAEAPEFGYGDAQVRKEIEYLAKGRRPLLRVLKDHVTLTTDGQDVLAGRADLVELNGIDRWLGGVHLRGSQAQWRWNGEGLVTTRVSS